MTARPPAEPPGDAPNDPPNDLPNDLAGPPRNTADGRQDEGPASVPPGRRGAEASPPATEGHEGTTPPPTPPPFVAGGEGRVDLGPRQQVREADLQWHFTRGSGPGGQNVNKVASAVELRVAIRAIAGLDEPARERLRVQAGHQWHEPDDTLVLRSRSARSQWSNRRICLERLAELVTAAARRPKVRRPTKPTRAARQRRLDEKKRQGDKKQRRRRPDLG